MIGNKGSNNTGFFSCLWHLKNRGGSDMGKEKEDVGEVFLCLLGIVLFLIFWRLLLSCVAIILVIAACACVVSWLTRRPRGPFWQTACSLASWIWEKVCALGTWAKRRCVGERGA